MRATPARVSDSINPSDAVADPSRPAICRRENPRSRSGWSLPKRAGRNADPEMLQKPSLALHRQSLPQIVHVSLNLIIRGFAVFNEFPDDLIGELDRCFCVSGPEIRKAPFDSNF